MVGRSTLSLCLVCAILLAALGGCSPPRSDDPSSTAPARARTADSRGREALPRRFTNYIETGDLKAMKERGTIRFVSLSSHREDMLPRAEIVTQRHQELAMAFAKRLKLDAVWIKAETPQQAIQLLLDGRADILADNLTDTEKRREIIDFSVPIHQVHEQLVAGTRGPEEIDAPDISAPDRLKNAKLIVPAQSSHVDTAKRLIAEFPEAGLTLQEVPYNDQLDDFMDLLDENPDMVGILDSNVIEGLREYRDDVRLGANVSEEENIAWGFRKDSPQLKFRLNNFLTRKLTTRERKRISDWNEIKKSGVLRLLTYNSATSYFLWKGILMGFDYDLAKAFADKHKLQLQVIVVPYDVELIQWLKEGRGDIAGSSITITQERIAKGVAFTAPYLEMPQQLLSNTSKPKLATLEDLNGRTLTVRAYSAFIETAEALRDSGIDVEVQVANPEISYQQIINMIADGELDATIVDAHAAKIEGALRPELLPGMVLTGSLPQGWMILPQNRELLKKADKFIRDFRKSENYRQKYNAYFRPNKRFVTKLQARIMPGSDLSPFDDLVKASAEEHEFDWRFVVAQMWQESNFNPRAVSPVGAQGLMQVMPRTAEDMGYPPPLFDPERNLKAGVKYLDWVRARFSPTLPLDTRLWFTLASYNAGYGHLLDAQRLAAELGLDPNMWFDNVEVAMLKLSEPRYFKKARYGYVRGSEPVQYVRNISNLYKAYAGVASEEMALAPAARPPTPPLRNSASAPRHGLNKVRIPLQPLRPPRALPNPPAAISHSSE